MELLLTNRFRALGTALGLTNCRTRQVGQITELYLCDRHALQMEIDWRENELFVYEEHLLQCLEFYEALIHRDSGVLLRFLDSMDERI